MLNCCKFATYLHQSSSRARVTLKRILWGQFCIPFGPLGQGSTIGVKPRWIQGVRASTVVHSTTYLRSHHTNVTCIDNTCRTSKVSWDMYKVHAMAKINIFCYAHNRFRVSKGYTYAQSLVNCTYCIAFSLLSWAIRAHSQWTVLSKHTHRDGPGYSPKGPQKRTHISTCVTFFKKAHLRL